MYIGLQVSTFYSRHISMELEFFQEFFIKYTQVSNFTEIRPVGAELFHADGRIDGRTDLTKLSRGHPFGLLN
jgi:hypothetical protein